MRRSGAKRHTSGRRVPTRKTGCKSCAERRRRNTGRKQPSSNNNERGDVRPSVAEEGRIHNQGAIEQPTDRGQGELRERVVVEPPNEGEFKQDEVSDEES